MTEITKKVIGSLLGKFDLSDTEAATARQEFFVKLQFRGKAYLFLRIKRFKEETY